MHIDQLSRITGVPVATIKHYEQVDLLPSTVTIGDKTDYGESHIHAIKLIKMAQDIGLSLREIMSVLAAKDSDQSTLRLNRAMMLLNKRRNLNSDEDGNPTSPSFDSLEKELEALFLP